MSTIYVFQTECPAHTGAPLAADRVLMWNSSSGRTEYVSAALLAESGRTVTSGSTGTAFSPYGITVTGATAAVYSLTDPTQAGQEATIIFPSSTAIQTVAPVAATIGGSTVTPAGATKITHTGTSDALGGAITLFASSTSKWYIKSMTAGAGITST